MSMDAIEMVSSALLGSDAEVIVVGGKVHIAHPPTIKKITGAAPYLKGVAEAGTVGDLVGALAKEDLALALSWLLDGNAMRKEEFMDADVNEVASGITAVLNMIDPGNFSRLSAFARNVRSLIARPR